MSVTLRTPEPADAEAWAAVRLSCTPYQVFTADGIRHWWATTSPEARQLLLIAEVDGRTVGIARGALNTWTSEEGAAGLNAMVHPEFRGLGIGTRLYDALADHLATAGARRVKVWACDEPAATEFLGRRGYERTHELRFSRLDLTGELPPMPALPDGVTVASAAEVGPRGVFAVDSVAMEDEPDDITTDAVAYDDWIREIWEGPELDLDASTVVLVDGQPASLTLIEADHATGRIWSGGTGTLREHRGKGYAKLAKSVAVRRAAERGITTAYTSNDEVNRPMLAVNEWLGYRPCARQWAYLKTL
ncbi:GNAT family N-acetyltransferase [Hamadaea tsunoensis]|uniref:GNAT family N-acetyltransferase n=1 Tax=Hamadaea tsunoensis TaxID=53368 RepID=UPI000414797D|nr:GNAT family N-acetyltransferase [Hamadaea tsunoensis]